MNNEFTIKYQHKIFIFRLVMFLRCFHVWRFNILEQTDNKIDIENKLTSGM